MKLRMTALTLLSLLAFGQANAAEQGEIRQITPANFQQMRRGQTQPKKEQRRCQGRTQHQQFVWLHRPAQQEFGDYARNAP